MTSKIVSAVFGFTLFFSAAATALTPTQAQIDQFKSLSPEQQQALAKQYGVGLGSVNTNAAIPPPVVETPTVTPRDANPKEIVLEQAIVENAKPTTGNGKSNGEDKSKVLPAKQKLDQFGYELFAGTPSTFAPVTNIPVPTEYIIGPGDTVIVQLYGKENATHELAVNREGVLQFPDLGPVSVAGLSFAELKSYLNETVSQKMIGVNTSITMGTLRSIQIFVLGEAFRPGAYTVSALSNMTNALLVSGGVTKIGSLRNVELKRKGNTVARLDLYDLLLKGDTSSDTRLQPGDVIFIPPIGITVGIAGEVRRPAIYELKNEKTAGELVQLAGGFLPTAYPPATRIDRIDDRGDRTLVDVNLTSTRGKGIKLRDGDVVQIFPVLDKVEGVVLVKGHLQRPGGITWRKGMHVRDVIPSIDTLLPDPDLNYALIKRELLPGRRVQVISFQLGEAISRPSSSNNIELMSRDELLIFGLGNEKRKELINPLLENLQLQAEVDSPAKVVKVTGGVRFPGDYPLTTGMTTELLINAAGGLSEVAFGPGADRDLNYALLKRIELPNHNLKFLPVSLSGKKIESTGISSRLLQPRDELLIFGSADRASQMKPLITSLVEQAQPGMPAKVVTVSGNVRYPGEYPMTENMTPQDLLDAAGGLLENAFVVDAEITRSGLDEHQFQRYQRIAVSFSGQAIPGAISNRAILQARDQLTIKSVPGWNEKEYVEVLGEVNFPGRYPIFRGDTIKKLVERAGGLNEYADPYAAIFLRESLRLREQEQIDKFKQRLQTDVARLKMEAAQSKLAGGEEEKIGENLLTDVVSAKATGRLVVDMESILAGKLDVDVSLQNGDKLVLPRRPQEVSVIGEVQFPTSHLYRIDLDAFDYVNISGGFTPKSNEKFMYVIRSNGRVEPVKKHLFYSNNSSMNPGDTIVVPYDVQSMSAMTYWTNISQILFHLSTTVAALKTVGAF